MKAHKHVHFMYIQCLLLPPSPLHHNSKGSFPSPTHSPLQQPIRVHPLYQLLPLRHRLVPGLRLVDVLIRRVMELVYGREDSGRELGRRHQTFAVGLCVGKGSTQTLISSCPRPATYLVACRKVTGPGI